MLRDVTRASRWKLVGINEESTVGITGVQGQHAVVHILLCAFALVARGQEAASGIWGLTCLQTGSLGVVVVSISVVFGDVLKDNAPIPLNVDSTFNLDVVNIAWAQIALRSDPVGRIIRTMTLGSTSVVVVVETVFLVGSDVVDQIIGRLVSHIRVLLQEDWILADLVGDVVLGIFGIFQTEGQVCVVSACWRSLGITVAMGSRMRRSMRVVRGGVVGYRVGSK